MAKDSTPSDVSAPPPWADEREQPPPETITTATTARRTTCDRCGAAEVTAGAPARTDAPPLPEGWLEAELTWGPRPPDPRCPLVAMVWLCPPCQQALAGCMGLEKWTWDGEGL